MLEVPVAYAVENHAVQRPKATLIIGAVVTVVCMVIVANFEALFDLVVTITTEYSQPIGGFCPAE